MVKSLPAWSATLLFAVSLTSCSLDASTAEDEPRTRGSTVECERHDPYPDLPALADDFAHSPSVAGLIGGDIAADVLVSRGHRLVAFGDSIVASTVPATSIVRNSLLVFTRDQACLVLGPQGSAFVPNRADGVGYWPMSLLEVVPGRTVVAFVQRVRDRYAVEERFVTLGPSLAEISIDADGAAHVVGVIDLGDDETSRERIGWGAASWNGPDGYAYVYGTANPDHELAFGWSLHVARVPIGRVLDAAAWRYWDGRKWNPDEGSAVPLIPAVGGVSQTLSVFAEGDRWYAVSKRDDYLGSDVVIWSAPGPAGPFDAGTTVARRPSDLAAGKLAYAALAHPSLFPQKGTIVISVSHNTTDPAALEEDPTLYRPEFFRVPLP